MASTSQAATNKDYLNSLRAVNDRIKGKISCDTSRNFMADVVHDPQRLEAAQIEMEEQRFNLKARLYPAAAASARRQLVQAQQQ